MSLSLQGIHSKTSEVGKECGHSFGPIANPSVYRIEVLFGQNGQGLRKSAPQDMAENSYIGEALYGQGGRLRRFSSKLHLILHQRTLRKKT